jgi:hypothetical protein
MLFTPYQMTIFRVFNIASKSSDFSLPIRPPKTAHAEPEGRGESGAQRAERIGNRLEPKGRRTPPQLSIYIFNKPHVYAFLETFKNNMSQEFSFILLSHANFVISHTSFHSLIVYDDRFSYTHKNNISHEFSFHSFFNPPFRLLPSL